MRAETVRFRYSRKTGEFLEREVLEIFEIAEHEYREKLVMALTGKGPTGTAQMIIDHYAAPDKGESTVELLCIGAIRQTEKNEIAL